MAARPIASLTLSFGLVTIPIRVFSATESTAGVSFNFLHQCGSRVKQQYVCEDEQVVVPRSEMVKGYEFERGRYVMFSTEELKALEEGARHSIDIVAFIPGHAVDPLYYDKAYLLGPDKRGAKPYALLVEAMKKTGRCALAKWAWKGKEYVVQVRAAEEGLVLQQLLYADEVRSLKDLGIEHTSVQNAELDLAVKLIEQTTQPGYDPTAYQDTEKERILAAIDRKVAGKEIVEPKPITHVPATGEVVDLMDALRASLGQVSRVAPAPEGVPSEIAGAAAQSAGAPALAAKAAKRSRRVMEPAATPGDVTAKRTKGGKK
jgi:DNA end-binding protein Ku